MSSLPLSACTATELGCSARYSTAASSAPQRAPFKDRLGGVDDLGLAAQWTPSPHVRHSVRRPQQSYRTAHDHASVRRLLLEPAGPSGSGQVVLCAHDPLTGIDHRDVIVRARPDAVLLVDTVFAFRPEWDHLWDYRIWLEV